MLRIQVIALILTAVPGVLRAEAPDPLAARFAVCTGRLSALIEYQWMTDPPASSHTEILRRQMLDLLSATTSEDQADAMLNLRIEAKYAQARLFRRASYNRDPRDAALAAERATVMTAACEALVLPPAGEALPGKG